MTAEIIRISILTKLGEEPEHASDDEADITLMMILLRLRMELFQVVIPTVMIFIKFCLEEPNHTLKKLKETEVI